MFVVVLALLFGLVAAQVPDLVVPSSFYGEWTRWNKNGNDVSPTAGGSYWENVPHKVERVDSASNSEGEYTVTYYIYSKTPQLQYTVLYSPNKPTVCTGCHVNTTASIGNWWHWMSSTIYVGECSANAPPLMDGTNVTGNFTTGTKGNLFYLPPGDGEENKIHSLWLCWGENHWDGGKVDGPFWVEFQSHDLFIFDAWNQRMAWDPALFTPPSTCGREANTTAVCLDPQPDVAPVG
eukprot:TRINITY_DN67166_c1_g2_i1.p1 TRINITY_DN67166_c1_g2~~TRINITY_DN67166_c1_g2_i1.p1  ORF type:complete len:236 (-),score=24.02 TRINITY_DN67166_c1_g2_i1:71-778(-)